MYGGLDDVHEYGRYGLSPRTERLATLNIPHCLENAQAGRFIDKVKATKSLHRLLIEDTLIWVSSEAEHAIARNFLDVSQISDGLRRLASSLIDQHINHQKRAYLDQALAGEIGELQQLDKLGYRKSIIAYKSDEGDWLALFPEKAEYWELERSLDQYRQVAERADARGDHVESVMRLWAATGDTSGTLGEAIDRAVAASE